MAKVTIRRLEPADLPRVHGIRVRAFTPIHKGFRARLGQEIFERLFFDWREKQGAHLDGICGPESGKEVYVAIDGGLIVGFVGLSADVERKTGEIDLNAVDPDYQNRGIGTALYEFAIARLKSKGAQVVSVGTGGDDAHSPARAAYAKAGFGSGIPSVFYVRRI